MPENSTSPGSVLIVDDEPNTLESLDVALQMIGISETICCQDARQVAGLLETNDFEIVLLDYIMPHLSGSEILDHIKTNHPDLPVIMITGVNEVETAVECMRRGAFDYILKPLEPDQLEASINRALELRKLRRENERLRRGFFREGLEQPEAFREIVTVSHRMQAMMQYCEAVGPGSEPVLISGETGTGKELVARGLHQVSGRAGKLVTINVAGLDDTMFSDALFGHVKGAFTGAEQTRRGLVEQAAGGTLFLDEVGDLAETSQVKLLRLLQEREFYPLGADNPSHTDTRVIVATNRNIRDLRDHGKFRADLYFRLRSHMLLVPPLRERTEDIHPLLDHFLEQAATDLGKPRPAYPPELLKLLNAYHFPGNVRELKAMVFDAVSRHAGRMMSLNTFHENIGAERDTSPDSPDGQEGLSADSWAGSLTQFPTLKNAAKHLVLEAMRRSDGNQRVAAGLLGITQQALSRRLSKMDKED